MNTEAPTAPTSTHGGARPGAARKPKMAEAAADGSAAPVAASPVSTDTPDPAGFRAALKQQLADRYGLSAEDAAVLQGSTADELEADARRLADKAAASPAKTRQGTPCRARCVADGLRCRLHGGTDRGKQPKASASART